MKISAQSKSNVSLNMAKLLITNITPISANGTWSAGGKRQPDSVKFRILDSASNKIVDTVDLDISDKKWSVTYPELDSGIYKFWVALYEGTKSLVIIRGDYIVEQTTPDPEPEPEQEYSAQNPPASGWVEYGTHSYFARPLRDYLSDPIQVDSNSLAKTKQVFTSQPQVTENSNVNWGIPYFYGRTTDPTYTIRHTGEGPSPTNKNYAIDTEGKKVHAPHPLGASLGGADQNINIVDQVPDANGKQWYYVIRLGTNGNIDNTNRIIRCYRCIAYEIGGSGMRYINEPPPVHQPIRPVDLTVPGGNIGYMMEINTDCVAVGPVGWYSESDAQGRKPCSAADADLPRFGDVFFLDMSESEITAKTTTTWGRNLLRGLRDYGAVLARNSGADWDLKFESSTGYAQNPWVGAISLPLRYGELLSISEWQSKMKIIKPSSLPPRI